MDQAEAMLFLENHMGMCGCFEKDLFIKEIISFLDWVSDMNNRPKYSYLFPERVGLFYLLVGAFDDAGLVEHGVSARVPWITKSGKDLLAALKSIDLESI